MKTKPGPIVTRRQSFNGDVKAPGQPPSPLVQQVSRRKEKHEEPVLPLHAKSASLSSLLVNNDETTPTGVANGLMGFGAHRGHQELSSCPLDRQSIIDMQKDIQPFIVATTKLKEVINKAATGKIDDNIIHIFIATCVTSPHVTIHVCLEAFISFVIIL